MGCWVPVAWHPSSLGIGSELSVVLHGPLVHVVDSGCRCCG